MKRKLFALFLVIISLTVLFFVYEKNIPSVSRQLYEYYISNYEKDTGSYNIVAAIYLNYRFFDTIFETLTLLISVIGIIHFSRHTQSGEVKDE